MEISQLKALMDAGTTHNFNATFGNRTEGARGTVIKVGAPADQNIVWVRNLAGHIHNWDRHTMSMI